MDYRIASWLIKINDQCGWVYSIANLDDVSWLHGCELITCFCLLDQKHGL